MLAVVSIFRRFLYNKLEQENRLLLEKADRIYRDSYFN